MLCEAIRDLLVFGGAAGSIALAIVITAALMAPAPL